MSEKKLTDEQQEKVSKLKEKMIIEASNIPEEPCNRCLDNGYSGQYTELWKKYQQELKDIIDKG